MEAEVSESLEMSVQQAMMRGVPLYAAASVVAVEGSSFDILVQLGEPQKGVDRITIPLHDLTAMPQATQGWIDQGEGVLEQWLSREISKRFVSAAGSAFINGDGIDKPKGILNPPKVPNENWQWGSLGYVNTIVSGAFEGAAAADSIVRLVYALAAEYRANGAFLMNSKTAGAARKLKDADGRFLWQDSMQADGMARLIGYPVLICEDMPDIGDRAFAVAFGDWRAGYTIATRPDIRVKRDGVTAKPNVIFWADTRMGGAVTDYAAIKLLRFVNA